MFNKHNCNMKRKDFLIIGMIIGIAATVQAQIQHSTAWLRADSATV